MLCAPTSPAAWAPTEPPCSPAIALGRTASQTSFLRTTSRALTVTQHHVRCGRCSNNCQLTINDFGGGSRFITGNRCEKGAGHPKSKTNTPNVFIKKNDLLFNRELLDPDARPRAAPSASRARSTCTRIYPFWHAFFTRWALACSCPTSRARRPTGGHRVHAVRERATRPRSATAT